MPYIADIKALPRVQRRGGNAERITAYASPDSRPAPSPCTARPMSSTGIDGLTVHTSEPAANTPKPIR
ncbi:hypothetical protein SAMN05421505_1226 [Sinosporangium album]|uniref:Uncharacterized protein n=1 Tax=Sinosporangium album TaxID=504805 RepID=A0A1G8F1P3_9ACTN|nr:hypothetical protein [Sinosporangium album]SDH75919.1 hypothetical protein SAMN05421505_1226 [Sinosporangium album]